MGDLWMVAVMISWGKQYEISSGHLKTLMSLLHFKKWVAYNQCILANCLWSINDFWKGYTMLDVG